MQRSEAIAFLFFITLFSAVNGLLVFSAAAQASTKEKVARPQEPKPPFPYRSFEVRYDNQSAQGVTLAAKLTLPEGNGPFPVVLLISGSGQSTRDVPFQGHKFQLVLADFLIRRGIGVLRYDDRGAGESTPGPKPIRDLTGEDHVSDARAGINFLQKHPEIDKKRIGLVGSSEGAGVAQVIAARSPEEIAFVVLLSGAGSGTKGEIVATQSEVMAKLRGFSKQAQKADREFVRRSLVVMREVADYDKRLKMISAIADEQLAKIPEKERAAIEPGIRTRVKILASESFHQDARRPPENFLRQVRCPVLALFGTKDTLIPAKIYAPRALASLKAGGNKDYTVKSLKNLNHMLQTAKTGLMEEAGEIEETMSPIALEIIADWIIERAGKVK